MRIEYDTLAFLIRVIESKTRKYRVDLLILYRLFLTRTYHFR